MKIIHSKPILIISEEEKKILEQAKDIIDKITDEDRDIIDTLFEDYGADSNTMYHAYNAIKGLLEASVYLTMVAGLITD